MNLHDLASLLASLSFLRSARGTVFSAAALVAFAISIRLLGSDIPVLAFAAYVIVSISVGLILYIIAQRPTSWLRYVAILVANLGLSIVRFAIISLKFVFVGIVYLIYLISPIDLIPGDLVTVFGILDDAALGLFYVGWVMSSANETPPMEFELSTRDNRVVMAVVMLFSFGIIGFLVYS